MLSEGTNAGHEQQDFPVFCRVLNRKKTSPDVRPPGSGPDWQKKTSKI